MITHLRNKAIQRLGFSFASFVLTIALFLTGTSLPKALVGAAAVPLITFTLIFYIQGNIALAQARGYDGSVVAAVIIFAALCLGWLFFAMPLILLFGLKDKTKRRRSYHANADHANSPR